MQRDEWKKNLIFDRFLLIKFINNFTKFNREIEKTMKISCRHGYDFIFMGAGFR